MFKASLQKHTLNFKRASGTSRGVLTQKDSWFIKLWEEENPNITGIGEASIIKTLSPEWNDFYEEKLEDIINNVNIYINKRLDDLESFPSIYFALETALKDLKMGGKGILFPSDFTHNNTPISINGLIWMGSKTYMLDQIKQKISEGFSCIKLKIGAIDFNTELEILEFIRKHYTNKEIEIRVDANGAFSPNEALKKLEQLAEFDLHSIEQPIRQGQFEAMKNLCASTPLPIALDEELIGITGLSAKEELLKTIQPQYIILKPSLIGGLKGSDEWISLAEKHTIDWWITSALESNIGLNAIAQYTFTKRNPLPQGLGTGQLYTNNVESPLEIRNGKLHYVS